MDLRTTSTIGLYNFGTWKFHDGISKLETLITIGSCFIVGNLKNKNASNSKFSPIKFFLHFLLLDFSSIFKKILRRD